MMKATPAASFIVPEPDFLLELLIIALDAPAQLGGIDQIAECDAARQSREPVLGRLLLALGPLDQQPFFGRFAGSFMARCNVNTQPRKPRGQPFIAALPPLDGAPSAVPQSEGEVLDRDRIGRVTMTLLPCPAPLPWRGGHRPRPRRSTNTADTPPAGSHGDWQSTVSPRPGNSPACQAARNTGVTHPQSAAPFWECRCRR